MIEIKLAQDATRPELKTLLRLADPNLSVFVCMDGEKILSCVGFYCGAVGEIAAIWCTEDSPEFDAKTAVVKGALNYLDLTAHPSVCYRGEKETAFLQRLGFVPCDGGAALDLTGYFDKDGPGSRCSCQG